MDSILAPGKLAPSSVAGHIRLYGKQGKEWDLTMSVFTDVA